LRESAWEESLEAFVADAANGGGVAEGGEVEFGDAAHLAGDVDPH
jgi:hypothetical protein